MLYEYRCDAGHVIEAHVKLNGEGTPSACTKEIDKGVEWRKRAESALREAMVAIEWAIKDDDDFGRVLRSPTHMALNQAHAQIRWVLREGCGAPLTRILSVGSPYFPGAGSWRGA